MHLFVICDAVFFLFTLRVMIFYNTISVLGHLKMGKRGPPHETEVLPEATLVNWAAEVKGGVAKCKYL